APRPRLPPGRGQPRREIGGSTSQFNHIEVSDVAKDAEEPVWNREQPPHHIRSRPHGVSRGIGKTFVQHPPERSVHRNLGSPVIPHPATVGARHRPCAAEYINSSGPSPRGLGRSAAPHHVASLRSPPSGHTEAWKHFQPSDDRG